MVTKPGTAGSLPPIESSGSKAPIRLGKLSYRKTTATLRYKVGCAAGSGRCRGHVSVFTVPIFKSKVTPLRKEQRLGTRKFDRAAGQSVLLSYKLSASARRWLKQAKTYKAIAYGVSTSTSFGVSTAKTTAARTR